MTAMKLSGRPNGKCRNCGKRLKSKPSLAKKRRYCGRDCYMAGVRRERRRRLSSEVRTCTSCGTSKPLSDFHLGNKSNGEGFQLHCKACRCAAEKRRREDPVLVAKFRAKYSTDLQFRARELLRSLRKRGKRHGFNVTLTEGWLAERYSRTCELSGFSFDLTGADRFFAPTVDRIKAGGDYSPENCRMIIWGLNCALQDWGLDKYLLVAKVMTFINFPEVSETPTGRLRSVA